MDLAQGIFNILSMVVSAGLAFGFGVWMLNIQKKKNKEQEQTEREKTEAERKKLEAEVWQMVNDELREQIEGYKGERKLLIDKYTELENTFEQARRLWLEKEIAWNKERTLLESKVNELTTELSILRRDMQRVKRDTDELKRGDTGPVPPAKRKPPDKV